MLCGHLSAGQRATLGPGGESPVQRRQHVPEVTAVSGDRRGTELADQCVRRLAGQRRQLQLVEPGFAGPEAVEQLLQRRRRRGLLGVRRPGRCLP